MKHNKTLLFILLLSSIAASIFATTLSIGKDRYMEARAAMEYRTVYLYVPNDVTKPNGTSAITWDTTEQNVKVYDYVGSVSTAGYVMNKISANLYTYTLYMNNVSSSKFEFTTKIGETVYKSIQDGINGYYFNTISSSKNLLTMVHYNIGSASDDDSNWSGYSVNTAEKFARTFLAVLHGTCDNEGVNTDMNKLSSVWNEMKALFTAAAFEGEELNHLKNAKRSDDDIYGDFARLYDLIYSKYSATVGNNFVNRNIAQLAVANITPSITNRNNINMIVAISIGATSIAIVSLYFFIRKRKEK